MSVIVIDEAFILAAGMGTRMRPLTDHVPKPMVEIAGAPIVGHELSKLEAVGVKRCVVNTHYKAEVLHDYLAQHKGAIEVEVSHEADLLDTGGGIKNALERISGDAFYVLSGDAYWEDAEGEGLLRGLAEAWDAKKMDILLVLQPVETMKLTHGVGDYDVDEDGRAVRSLDKSGAYMFTSIRINAACIFDDAPAVGAAFSYLELMDKAQQSGRLYAYINRGDWHHISTPQDLSAVNDAISGDQE